MGYQRGTNSGVSGIIDLPGVSGAKFQARVYGFGKKLTTATKPRVGRGISRWVPYRVLTTAGSFVISDAVVRLDAPPTPDAWKGQEGTVTLQYTTSKTVTVPVRITEVGVNFNEKAQDQWSLTIACQITAPPTWAGFGTAPVATDPSPSDLELYAGTSKTLDPNDLQSGATRAVDLWGNLTDTDAAEGTRLAAIVAAASTPPLTGLKIRTATFARDASDGGQVLITWGRTSTAEDVLLANTVTTTTVDELGNAATVAAINGSPVDPSVANTVKTGTETRNLNAGNTLTVDRYATRTPQQAIEFDGTTNRQDAQDLDDGGTVTVVTTSSTPPATPSAPGSSTLVYVDTTEVDGNHWKHTFTFGPTNTQQAKEYAGTTSTIDPSALRDGGTALVVNASSTAPATPTAPGASKLIATESTRLTSGGKWQHVFRFGPQTSADEITQGGTVTRDDAGDLDDGGEITVVQTSATPGATPAAPVTGSVFVGTSVRPIKDGQYAVTYRYGPRTTADAVTMDGTETRIDASLLTSGGVITLIQSTATPATAPSAPTSGSVLVDTMVKQLRSGKYAVAYRYGPRTSADEITMRAVIHDDPTGLEDKGEVIAIQSTATPATAPSAPLSGTVFTGVSTRQIKDNKFEQTYTYEPDTSADKRANAAKKGSSDPGGLNTRAFTAAMNSTAAAGTGQIVAVHNFVVDNNNVLYVTETGPRSTIQDVTFPNSFLHKDTFKLDSKQETTEIVGTGANGTAAATLAELKSVGTIRRQETPNYDRLTTVFDTLDSKERRTYPKTRDTYDRYTVDQERLSPEIIATTATAAAIATATAAAGTGDLANYKYVGTIATPETPTTGTAAGQTLLVHRYATADTSDRLTLPHLDPIVDPQSLTDTDYRASLFAVADGFPADPASTAAPATLKLVDRHSIPIPDDAYHRVALWRYGWRNSKDDVQMPATTARRDATANFDRVATSVLSCTAAATTVSLADSEWTAAMAATATASTIDFIDVRKITDTLYERRTHTTATGAIVTIDDSLGVWRMVQARLAAGIVQVYVPTVVSKGGSDVLAIVAPTRLLRVTATIRIRRKLMTDSAGVPATTPAAAIGTSNNATAFSFPAGTLTFVGRRIHEDNIGIGAAHPVWVEDVLLYQSDGQFDEAGITMGPQWTNAAVSVGWNAASTFGASWTGAAFAQVDYSGFFA